MCMNNIKNFVTSVVSLLLLLLFGGLAIWGIYAIFHLIITSLPPIVAGAIITGTLGIPSLVLGNIFIKKREIELKLREKRADVYEKFVKKIIHKITRPDEVSDEELTRFLIEFTSDVILWGSDKFVKNYSELRQRLINQQSNSLEFEDIMFDIRKDLGYSNQGLTEGYLFSLFVNEDIETIKKLRGIKTNLVEPLNTEYLGDKEIESEQQDESN